MSKKGRYSTQTSPDLPRPPQPYPPPCPDLPTTVPRPTQPYPGGHAAQGMNSRALRSVRLGGFSSLNHPFTGSPAAPFLPIRPQIGPVIVMSSCDNYLNGCPSSTYGVDHLSCLAAKTCVIIRAVITVTEAMQDILRFGWLFVHVFTAMAHPHNKLNPCPTRVYSN
jgi:hypothetical protein